jgi:hypothetical protein
MHRSGSGDRELTGAKDELEEHAPDVGGRLLHQVKQGHLRSIGRFPVLVQAATIRRRRRRRWLLLSDKLSHTTTSSARGCSVANAIACSAPSR